MMISGEIDNLADSRKIRAFLSDITAFIRRYGLFKVLNASVPARPTVAKPKREVSTGLGEAWSALPTRPKPFDTLQTDDWTWHRAPKNVLRFRTLPRATSVHWQTTFVHWQTTSVHWRTTSRTCQRPSVYCQRAF